MLLQEEDMSLGMGNGDGEGVGLVGFCWGGEGEA